ncbi:cysteine desulfurase family protein [Desulfoplanes formicivorans]|uniref:cysteine desulfurase n=1 Tax=Desulfoplanes formicivorans TaxID=1592317 RepID=A0A194AKD6_9BACT|nr:aminotransferase class V-fold PLP-dependent enzyme [Desulfoplanes formicivorans]GAU09778.1 cysteine desulfurase [Desulfoplanes formicivorans]
MKSIVYMDHAAATPVAPQVIEAMLPFFDREFANPSTVYDLGFKAKGVVDEQRARVAELINAEPEEILFTASGAEANNLAIKGSVFASYGKKDRIITSAIEHHSVLNSARFFERLGYEVAVLPVDASGVVDPKHLHKILDNDASRVALVSVMHGNAEIGTLEHIEALAALCHQYGVLFHTDAAATVGNIPVDVKDLGVDLLTISGPAFGAPKGTGALYFRRNTRLMPLVHGGIQERGRRAGTENVPGIVGLGTAASLARNGLAERMALLEELRDRLITGVVERVPHVVCTGHPRMRLPGHASFCIEAVEGEALIYMLSREGIYANTGSACASKALKISPVLGALGVPAATAQGSVVFTLNETNTPEEVDYVLEKLPQVVATLRAMSPIWKDGAPVKDGGHA